MKTNFHEFLAQYESRQRKGSQGVSHALEIHLAACFGDDLLLEHITESACFDFARFLTQRVAPTSARTYLQKLHVVLSLAVAQHLLKRNPMPPIRDMLPYISRPQRTYLLREEVSRLQATPCRNSETKRAFLFSCQTGLRISDIESLSWDDIRSVNGTPTIVKVQVKTRSEVRVPLNQIALQLLGSRHGCGAVFHLLSRATISADLRQWAADAGINKTLTFHVSRHTFATLSISAGVNIYVVSKLCGHSTVKTTEIYAHMIDDTLKQGINLLGMFMLDKSMKNRYYCNRR